MSKATKKSTAMRSALKAARRELRAEFAYLQESYGATRRDFSGLKHEEADDLARLARAIAKINSALAA